MRCLFTALLVMALLSGAPMAIADPPWSLHPSAAQWQAAQAALVARFAALGRTTVSVVPQRDRALGTMFWVSDAAGHALVAVRDNAVFDTRGDASVSAVLRADQMLAARQWSATNLVYLFSELDTIPTGGRDVADGSGSQPFLAPRLTYHDGHAELRLYTGRDAHAGAEAQHWIHLTRLTLTIDANYSLTWASARVRFDDRGHEFAD